MKNEDFDNVTKPKAGLIVAILTFVLIVLLIEVHCLQSKIDTLESREPVIIYQVDNAGTEMIGKVTGKDVVNGRYYVEVAPYGKFLVTKEQYEEIEIGQDMPEYLKGRGS
ncbi:DUF1372 family protein [Streptococcus suis]|nr:DUF1372 family protein [Streptococcus suis]